MVDRREVTDVVLLQVIEELVKQIGARVAKHGPGAFVSNHEAFGIVTEEYLEYYEAVKSNDSFEIASELFDVAVAAVFAVASMTKDGSVKPECDCDDGVIGCKDCPNSVAQADGDAGLVDVDPIADAARMAMIERANAFGIEIVDKF